MSEYHVKKTKDIYKGKLFKITQNELKKKAIRELVVHPGAVAIVPLLDEDHVVLIQQFRSAAEEILWEILEI